MSRVLIRGGRVVCPASEIDAVLDVHVVDGRVADLSRPQATVPLATAPPGFAVVDARGKWVLPGLVDLCCYVREPGREDDEDLATTLRSAGRGGFTTLLSMPASDPTVDGGDDVEHRVARAASVGGPRVLVAGALTRGRAGKELADLGEMALAGAVAFTDAPDAVDCAEVLRRAMEYAASFGSLVIAAGALPSLSRGVVAEGALSTRLGLPGVPAAAEVIAVARHVELCRLTGARVHLGALSCARAVALVEAAQQEGLPVTAEAHPWSLVLDEDALRQRPYDTALRLTPPLRSVEDREALLDAVRRGVLVVASGHSPVARHHKEVEFAAAEAGAATLDLVVALLASSTPAGLSAPELARALSWGPARVLGLPDTGRLAPGCRGDVVVIDPAGGGAVVPAGPFAGRTTTARVAATVALGRLVHNLETP